MVTQLDCAERVQPQQGVVWPQPKLIRDSNPCFRINSDSDLDVCRIAARKLWISYLIGISHLLIVMKIRRWLWNTTKFSDVFYSAMARELKKWSASGTGSPPKVSQLLWLVGPVKSADYFCSNCEWSTERITDKWHWLHNFDLVEVIKGNLSTVCSTKVLCPQNLFLRKLQRHKGRISRYVDIQHLCFWHRHLVGLKMTIFCNDVNKTSTSIELLTVNILCYMSKGINIGLGIKSKARL